MAVKISFNIPEDFFEHEEDKKYAGEYVLERLKGWEKLQVDKECRTIDYEEGTVEIDDNKWTLLITHKSLTKPKKTVEELKEFPPGLLDFLTEEATKLNSLSKKKRDFLSSQWSTKSRQLKR